MPPKNPGPITGRIEMKNPPGTTHGGQQATRYPWDSLAEAASNLRLDPVEDPHDWTLILVPSHHVAAINAVDLNDRKAASLGLSRVDPQIRFVWPDVIRGVFNQIVNRPPRLIIETREFGYTRENPEVAEFIYELRKAHGNLMQRRDYAAQWIQL